MVNIGGERILESGSQKQIIGLSGSDLLALKS
jgi:hypothetical protein